MAGLFFKVSLQGLYSNPFLVMIHPNVCSPVPALSWSCSLFSLGLFGYSLWGWSPLLLLDPGVPIKDEPRSILESSVTGAVVYLFSGAGCSSRASNVMGFSSAVPVNWAHSYGCGFLCKIYTSRITLCSSSVAVVPPFSCSFPTFLNAIFLSHAMWHCSRLSPQPCMLLSFYTV